MKLLIVTQKVDKADPILGFFHRWLEEFAAHCEEVHVIGQLVGEYNLPDNVKVYSLGKENNISTFAQMLNYWKLSKRLHKKTDVILVHMTPIWVVLSWFYRKPKYLWYEARGTRWPLRVALKIVKKVFSASPYGMPIKSKKSLVVGHGIDTEKFQISKNKKQKSLITVSRITRAKNLDVILEAVSMLPDEWQLSICGKTITADDQEYAEELQLESKKNIAVQSVSQEDLIPLLQKAKVFLHASSTPLDKAVLEAMACGCPVVSTSEAIQPILPEICRATDAKSMAEAVLAIEGLSEAEYKALATQQRSYVEMHHNLQKLVARLVQEM